MSIPLLQKLVLSRGRLRERNPSNQTSQDLAFRIGAHARGLFLNEKLLCTEAVFTALNQTLRGGLEPQMALRLASGFTDGLAGSGCLCGAVSGGVLALGLFLGKTRPGSLSGRRVRARTRDLYSRFADQAGSTCCRVLTKKVKEDPEVHFRQCAELTGAAAEIAARLILAEEPELAAEADWSHLGNKADGADTNSEVREAL
jgi:C_GCAxxG_C_C family probable redox protein